MGKLLATELWHYSWDLISERLELISINDRNKITELGTPLDYEGAPLNDYD